MVIDFVIEFKKYKKRREASRLLLDRNGTFSAIDLDADPDEPGSGYLRHEFSDMRFPEKSRDLREYLIDDNIIFVDEEHSTKLVEAGSYKYLIMPDLFADLR